MKSFIADLHMHTCLSSCAELDMTPKRMIEQVSRKGIDIIAVTDHNSARNTEVAVQIGREHGITVLPGLEVSSKEEAHVLAIFDSPEAAAIMQEKVYSYLGETDVDSHMQVVVNGADEVLAFERKLLIGATGLKLKQLVGLIRDCGGLAIASHVDRGAFSVMSQLGFVPDDVSFDAVEVIDQRRADEALVFHKSVTRIMSSDAHHIGDIGRRCTELRAESPTFNELALALRGEGGREVILMPEGVGQ